MERNGDFSIKLGIDADKSVRILREEVLIRERNKAILYEEEQE